MSGSPKAGTGALRALLEALPAREAERAFAHSSWVEDRFDSYGRLAFLGDSVLRLAMASRLISGSPEGEVGDLTKTLNQAVSARSCAAVARELGVVERLHEVEPSSTSGVKVADLVAHDRPLAEVLEAVIGACFEEFGYERTAEAVNEAFAGQVEIARNERIDFKSALQERLARTGDTVTYEVATEDGPPHDRRFEVVASVGGEPTGTGTGRSKKEAEQAAAAEALESFGD